MCLTARCVRLGRMELAWDSFPLLIALHVAQEPFQRLLVQQVIKHAAHVRLVRSSHRQAHRLSVNAHCVSLVPFRRLLQARLQRRVATVDQADIQLGLECLHTTRVKHVRWAHIHKPRVPYHLLTVQTVVSGSIVIRI